MTDIKVKCSACGHFTRITDSEINRVYQQGKADAIDGINKIIQFIKDNSFNHKLEYDSFKAIGSSVVIELLEQLKEQKK